MPNPNSSNMGSPEQTPPCTVREQDQYMPIANTIRIMRRILPVHAKISDDAKETIQECVSEFISFITGEANDRCQHEQRKTITGEDVLWAMGKLGFDNYIWPLSLYLNRYREIETERTALRGEPLIRRANSLDYESIGSFGLQPYGGIHVDHQNHQLRYFDAAFTAINECHRDGVGASGSASGGVFNPYAQFKYWW